MSQSNIFGTGNALSFQVSTGSVNQVYSLSFTNPYYTDDGVSRGFDIYKRDVDASSLSVGSYNTSTLGAGVRFGVPVTEYDTVNYGLAYEHTKIGLLAGHAAALHRLRQRIRRGTDTMLGTVGWARDKRDSVIYTTERHVAAFTAEVGLPGWRPDLLPDQLTSISGIIP